MLSDNEIRHRINYKVGDYVRIREWDDMECECGTNNDYHIDTPALFVREMEYLCGKICKIDKIIEPCGLEDYYVFHISEEDGSKVGWQIDAFMIEPLIQKQDTWDCEIVPDISILYGN